MQLEEAPVIGPIGPTPDGLDAPFWEGLHAGELRIQRCAACADWVWAPAWRCPGCGSWELGWEAVAPEGRVYSWIRSWQPFSPVMAPVAPFVTLLVELPHVELKRVIGLLVGSEEGLRIGAPVRGVLQPASDLTCGYPIWRWQLGEDA